MEADGPSARAFTTGLKPGALARTSVAHRSMIIVFPAARRGGPQAWVYARLPGRPAKWR